jgi:hypothetical protein
MKEWEILLYCAVPVLVGGLLGILVAKIIVPLTTRSKKPPEPHTIDTSTSPSFDSSDRDSGYDRSANDEFWEDRKREGEAKRQKELDDLHYSGPVDTSHMSESDKRWVENLRSRGYSDYDINEKIDKTDKNRCFIATASLQGRMPLESLISLKLWRYSVLESTKPGRILSNFYRKSAPEIARKVETRPVVSAFLRTKFIQPALGIVQKRQTLLRDLSLSILFLSMLSAAILLTAFDE